MPASDRGNAVVPAADWADHFFDAYEACGNVSIAAKAAGVTRAAAYKRRRADAGFAGRWADATEVAADALEAEAWRRAVHGTDEPVFHKGQVVGVLKKYSDTLLVKLLAAHRPDKFRDTAKVTLGGDPRNPVAVGGVHVVGSVGSVCDRIDQLTRQFAGDRPVGPALTAEMVRGMTDDELRAVIDGHRPVTLTAADVLAAERIVAEAREADG